MPACEKSTLGLSFRKLGTRMEPLAPILRAAIDNQATAARLDPSTHRAPGRMDLVHFDRRSCRKSGWDARLILFEETSRGGVRPTGSGQVVDGLKCEQSVACDATACTVDFSWREVFAIQQHLHAQTIRCRRMIGWRRCREQRNQQQPHSAPSDKSAGCARLFRRDHGLRVGMPLIINARTGAN